MTRFLAAIGLAVSFFAAAITSSAIAAAPLEGVDFVSIDPQPVAAGRIEVVEFFFYGCESCDKLEPALASWRKSLPPDVEFRRAPAIRRTAWVPLTRLYFALERMGELDRLHAQVYHAVHDEGLNLGNGGELDTWAGKVGLDRQKLAALLESDEVRDQVQRAHDATIAYGVRATPSFVVDGRYLTSGGMAGSVAALLSVVDGLIDKARTARATRKP